MFDRVRRRARHGAGCSVASTSIFDDNSEPLGVLLAARRDLHRRLHRRHHARSPPPAKVTGTVVGRRRAVVLRRDDVLLPRSVLRRRHPVATTWTPLITVLWLLGMTPGDQPHRRPRRARRRHRRHRRARRSSSTASKLTDLGLLDSGNVGPLIAIITAGVCVGFLPHNFNPARIFMGDGGALLLGLLLAVSTSVVGGRADPNTQRVHRPDVLLPRAARHPAVDPRRADPRHAVRDRPPCHQSPGARHGRQGPPAPPADEPRPRPPPQCA